MITDEIFQRYSNALLRGERYACASIVMKLLEQDITVKDLYLGLFQRSLYYVGELWEYNRISVATEHLVTSITESLFPLVYKKLFGAPHIGRKAVITAAMNEYHQIGARMVADMFELEGWDGYFLGANVPVGDLLRFITERKPDVLGFSLSVYNNLKPLLDAIGAVRTAHPELPIIVGGQAFRFGGEDVVTQFPKVRYLSSLTALEDFIREA